MSTIVKNIHIFKNGAWHPISKVFHQGEWKKMKGIFYDGVWYEIGVTCTVMPDGCAVNTDVHPRWNKSAYYGTNNLKFNAFPGGYRLGDGRFTFISFNGYWWSATESNAGNAWYRSMHLNFSTVIRSTGAWWLGWSVRCIKDYTGIQPNGTILSNDYTDGDGNTYDAVVIGEQLWTIENLYTTKYQNGTNIPNVTDNNDWMYLTTGAYCWFNNDYNTWGVHYGALYNWYAMDGLVNNNGYRVPSDADWTQLTDYLINENWCNDVVVTSSNVAQYLKSCRQVNHPLVQPELRVWISGLDFAPENDEAYIEIYVNNVLQHTYEFITPVMEEPDIYNVTIGDTVKVIGTRVTTSGTLFFYNYAETYEIYEGQNTFTKTFTVTETYTEIQTGLEFL